MPRQNHGLITDHHRGEHHSTPTSEATSKPPETVSVATSDKPASPIDPNSCASPKDDQQQNLCIELHAAQATADQAFWAEMTFYVGIAGTVSIIWTLYYTRQAARAAEASAIAAVNAINLADNTSKTTQRAFVCLKYIKVDAIVLKGSESVVGWRFEPVWQNNGQTATRGGLNYINWSLFSDLPARDFVFQDLDYSNAENSSILIGPQSEISGEIHNVPTEHVADAKSLKGFLMLWGWFEYNDVFPNTERHRTEFCRLLEIHGSPTDRTCHMRLRFFGKHNGSDSECQHKPKTQNVNPAV